MKEKVANFCKGEIRMEVISECIRFMKRQKKKFGL